MPHFTLEVIAGYLMKGTVKLASAQRVLAEYGLTVRREPMGFTFWRGDRRVHGVFSHSPITPDQSATFLA